MDEKPKKNSKKLSVKWNARKISNAAKLDLRTYAELKTWVSSCFWNAWKNPLSTASSP
jgi:hypothetical protein